MSMLEPPTTGPTVLRDIKMPAAHHVGAWPARTLLKNTLAALTTTYLIAIASYFALAARLEMSLSAVAGAAVMLFAIFGLLVRALPGHPHQRFGPANIITAIRAAMVSFFGAAIIFANVAATLDPFPPAMVALVALALALDGVDGYFARRTGLQSALGTRFDMEIDALLILLLSLAGLLLGKAGWWVMAIGLMRYGFIFAQTVLPFMRAPLESSFRRKLICVVQVSALCVILLPMINPPISTAIAAIALLLLIYSFAVDVLSLMRKRSLVA